MITGFHHVCIKTRDWDRTMRFYVDLLGCKVKISWRAAPERAVMLDTGAGQYVEVFEDLAYQGPTNGAIWHFAFRTDRVDELAAKVRAWGAKITVEPKSLAIKTNGPGQPAEVPIRIFFCEGPNGESVEFFQNELT